MVILKSSEYRQAFKPRLEVYAPIYESNYGFRISKRKTEESHDRNPFTWEPSDEELDYELCQESARPPSVPVHIYKHALLNKAYKEKVTSPTKAGSAAKESEQKAASVTQESTEKLKDVSKDDLKLDIPEDSDQTASDKSEKSMEISTPKENAKEKQCRQKPSCEVVSVKPRKPKKPTIRKPLPKPRPVSCPVGRRLKKEKPAIPDDDVKPPFEAYGSWDQERKTGNQQTHNVRASCQIYPAALRAQKRRQYDIERRKKQTASVSASLAVRRRNLFNEQMCKETAAWDTEYRQHYVAFDAATYRANLSARCCTL